MNVNNGMRPVHPGEILAEELEELGMSANAMAKALGVQKTFELRTAEIESGQDIADRVHPREPAHSAS